MKRLLVIVAIFIGLWGISLATRGAASTAVDAITPDADMYDQAMGQKDTFRNVIVQGCVGEAPGQEAYCGCYADNVMATDRASFNELMAKSSNDTLENTDVMRYAAPCMDQYQ